MPTLLMLMVLLVCSAVPAAAEPVDLLQALQEAAAARPLIQAAEAEAEAAAAAVGEARSALLPRLVFTESFLVTDEPGGSLFVALNQEDLVLSSTAEAYNFPPSRRDFETRLSLEQPLYDPDLRYGVARAGRGAAAARAAADWSREQAAFAAFGAYLELQRASAAQEWAQSSRQQAAEALRLAEARHLAGIGLKADVLRARVFLAEARRREVTVQNDLAIGRRALALAMGRGAGEVEFGAPVAPELLSAEAPDVADRADLAALALRVEEAQLASRQSRAAYLPRVGLGASYALHDGSVPFGTEAGSWMVRAGLNWELFDGRRRAHTSARAAAAERASRLHLEEASRQAALALTVAKRRAEEARLNQLTAAEAVADGTESLRLLQERYAAGLSDLTTLLAAQAALDHARLTKIEAETEWLLALGTIRLQQGTFLHTFLIAKEAVE